MEYFIGAAITLLVLLTSKHFYDKDSLGDTALQIKFSQSRQFEKMGIFLYGIPIPKKLLTQATNHFDSSRLKIAMSNDRAYWIKNNSVYEAIILNGLIQEDSAKIVDMMALDDVKLKDMMFIIDSLTEGQSNDRGNTGNS